MVYSKQSTLSRNILAVYLILRNCILKDLAQVQLSDDASILSNSTVNMFQVTAQLECMLMFYKVIALLEYIYLIILV